MATTNFTYSCGHVGVAVGRNRKEADRKAVWLEGRGELCPECSKTNELTLATAQADKDGLPKLNGTSQKQIDYAMVVRARKLAQLQHLRDTQIKAALTALKREIVADDRIMPHHVVHHVSALLDAMVGALDGVEQNTSATWWLDVGPAGAVAQAWQERMKIMADALEANGVLPAKDAAVYARMQFSDPSGGL